MKVGINGLGRIGRLALRAAMGGANRPVDDPRGGNRLDVVHLNELMGGAAPSTRFTDGTMLKVYAWYDNEMGYACRMVDLANHLATRGA